MASPIPAAEAALSQPPSVHFVEFTGERGLGAFRNQKGMGSGLAAADYDNDGFVDVFVPQGAGVPNRLYRNRGDGSFEDVAAVARVASFASSRVALWLDYDGDGLLDLLVANDDPQAPSSFTLYRQGTDHTFTEVTAAAGLIKPPAPESNNHHWGGLCAGDINNDGYLDIFTGPWSGPATLFLNNGRGGFEDVSLASGVGGASSWHHQPMMYDFDHDGWMDIYAAIDFEPNQLWINRRDLTFEDEAPAWGLDNAMNDMGVTLGDYDNDGDFDIYVTNIFRGGLHNVLLRDDSAGGARHFTEVSAAMGVDGGHWGWGTTFLDADNDGMLDLAATNGWHTTDWSSDPSRFFFSPGDPTLPFEDVSTPIGFDDTFWGSALIAADFDRDGDLDLMQSCMEWVPTHVGRLRLLDNQPNGTPNGNHFLVIQPRMDGPNRFAIGAVVRIEAGGRRMMRLISAGTSYLGQEPAEAFFGLGASAAAEVVTVEWPGGGSTTLHHVAANQVRVIRPGDVDVRTVRIDIRPGHDDNKVKLGSKQKLRIAIFGETGFDTGDIEPSSIRVAGVAIAIRKDSRPRMKFEDLDRDGFVDCVIRLEDSDFDVGPDANRLELTGTTRDGRPFRGTDWVRWKRRHDPGAAPPARDQAQSAAAISGLAAFALHGAVPNPSAGAFAIAFTLAGGEPATLELFDLAGRRLLSRDVGGLGAGRHVVEVGEGARLAPGVYLIRLVQGEQRAVLRMARVR